QNDLISRADVWIQYIPDEYAEIITLRGQGYTNKELVDTLGLPRGTISSRWSRGKRCMNQILDHFEETGSDEIPELIYV
ncbi:MAG: hypothetical protein ABIH34_04805, partial [Nanoarchaeota archaeon]